MPKKTAIAQKNKIFQKPQTTQIDTSIIIPMYNSESTILACIESVKNQDFNKEFEIIVVDDGSVDNSVQIAQNCEVKVIRQQNCGPAKARNNGAVNSKGKIFVFTDADCTAQKNWLKEMLKPFENKDVVGVQGAYRSRQQSIVARFAQIEIEERYELMKKNSSSLDWIGSYSAAYRREDFFEAGGFDESFPKASGEDPELSYKLAKKGKKLVFSENAIVYHTHPDTLLKYLKTKYYRAFYRVNLYSKHKDKIANDSYTTLEIKIQILSGYLGTALFLLSLALVYLNHTSEAFVALVISTIFTIVGFLSQFKFMLFAARKDIVVALFSIVAIPLRTIVFSLGLIAGILERKVMK